MCQRRKPVIRAVADSPRRRWIAARGPVRQLNQAAGALGVQPQPVVPDVFPRAFRTVADAHAGALILLLFPAFFRIESARRNTSFLSSPLSSSLPRRSLMAYGPNLPKMYGAAAVGSGDRVGRRVNANRGRRPGFSFFGLRPGGLLPWPWRCPGSSSWRVGNRFSITTSGEIISATRASPSFATAAEPSDASEAYRISPTAAVLSGAATTLRQSCGGKAGPRFCCRKTDPRLRAGVPRSLP
jgi:hypothetical protein